MATTRTQLTTYLSTDDQHDDWRVIRDHYGGDMGDAVLIRYLFKQIADNIRAGRAAPPSSDRFDSEIKRLDAEMEELRRVISQLNK